jgi:rubrerythrin
MEVSETEVIEGLRKSKAIVGELYPVLKRKDTGEIIDGFTRKRADPTWTEKEVEIRNEKEAILYRLYANYRRRVSSKETKVQIITLAETLEKEGVPRELILTKIAELTPYSERWIRYLLPAKYKAVEKTKKTMPRKAEGHEEVLPHPSEETKKPTEEKVKTYQCPVCGTTLKLVGDLLYPV